MIVSLPNNEVIYNKYNNNDNNLLHYEGLPA